jgi:stress-induced morphogen
VVVVSPAFNGLSLVKQHRLVNQTLKPHIANLHGLTLATFTEEQWAEQLKQKGKQQ